MNSIIFAAKNKDERSFYMNKKKNNERQSPPIEIPATPFDTTPDRPLEIINAYGTYEIQPTADTENDFPAIAQGTPLSFKKRDPRFFRSPEDFNPASDRSSDHCI